MSNNYLDYYRELNKIRASKCYLCQRKSKYLDCIGARLVYVCSLHKLHNDAQKI
jgi:hypothetical protein